MIEILEVIGLMIERLHTVFISLLPLLLSYYLYCLMDVMTAMALDVNRMNFRLSQIEKKVWDIWNKSEYHHEISRLDKERRNNERSDRSSVKDK